MSLCIGWIRKTGVAEEVVLASDSCFSGGQRFMAAPKLFTMNRGDFAIACAGSTTYSFSVIEHVRQALDCNGPISRRAYDLTEIIHHIVDITNETLLHEKEQIQFCDTDFSMIIGGYSWKRKKAILQIIEYAPRKKMYYSHVVKTIKKSPVAVIGDRDAVMPARYAIFNRLEADEVKDGEPFDMQPLAVLMDFIKNPAYTTIDGVPQILKVYPFMNTMPIGVTCGNDSPVYFFGRKLLEYETFPYQIYNLETGEKSYMKIIDEKYRRGPEIIPELNVGKKLMNNRLNDK